jgi:RNA polymerase sigma-70 factor (ECF subfamily)
VHADPRGTEAFIRAAQRGEIAAFNQLVEAYQRQVYNVCYRTLGNAEDAADATQETFVSAYRGLKNFRGPPEGFRGWLVRIAVNACYDLARRRKPAMSLEEELVERAPTADHADRAAAAADVQRALLEIPMDFRIVLILHELQDQPLDEIAAALDVPVGTVKSRLHRGRVALGRVLAGEQPREPQAAQAPSKPPNP